MPSHYHSVLLVLAEAGRGTPARSDFRNDFSHGVVEIFEVAGAGGGHEEEMVG